jgi:hypothetical protein
MSKIPIVATFQHSDPTNENAGRVKQQVPSAATEVQHRPSVRRRRRPPGMIRAMWNQQEEDFTRGCSDKAAPDVPNYLGKGKCCVSPDTILHDRRSRIGDRFVSPLLFDYNATRDLGEFERVISNRRGRLDFGPGE